MALVIFIISIIGYFYLIFNCCNFFYYLLYTRAHARMRRPTSGNSTKQLARSLKWLNLSCSIELEICNCCSPPPPHFQLPLHLNPSPVRSASEISGFFGMNSDWATLYSSVSVYSRIQNTDLRWNRKKIGAS